MSRTGTLVLRVLVVPVVVVVVLAGIWVAGALLTNDFALAMWLTAGWMALAGLAALLVALRSRLLRWPVLGAYAVTAAAAGLYLGSSMFLDRVVDEQVAVAAPAAPAPQDAPEVPAEEESGPGAEDRPDAQDAAAEPARANVRVRGGRFLSVRHPAAGRATVVELAEGGRVLTLTDFEVDNGPDLRVYLVAGSPTSEGEVTDVVDLGALKGNRGDQQYEIPRDVDVGYYTTAVIWCRAFSVLFARAPLDR